MGKIKDLILEINETVNSNELATLAGASGLAEIEVGDDTIKDVKTKLGGLMSVDAAQNNQDLEDHFKKKLYGGIKGELLGNIDTDLMTSTKLLLGEAAVEKFKDIEFTGDKIKKFTALAKEIIEKKGGGDEELKTLNAGLNSKVAELSDNIVKSDKAKEKEIKKLNSEFKVKLIRKEFDRTINNYNLGDKYSEEFIKDALHKDIFKQVQSVAKLTLSDTESIIPKNPEREDMELYIDNKKIGTLKEILDPLMIPFIKKSEGLKHKDKDYVPAADVKLSRQAEDLIARRNQG